MPGLSYFLALKPPLCDYRFIVKVSIFAKTDLISMVFKTMSFSLQLFRKKAAAVLVLMQWNAADYLDAQLNDMLPRLSCLSMSMYLEVSFGNALANNSVRL